MWLSKYSESLLITLVFNAILQSANTMEPTMLKKVRECLTKPSAVICLKEEALDALNRTIMSEKSMRIFDLLDIEKDPSYVPNDGDSELPEDLIKRNEKLNSILYHKVEELFESRMIKFSLANAIEGRKKKDKTGSMMMLGGIAMAGMMGQMFMGKIAFLAGAALLVAKMALMLSAISALKKSGGGGGSGEQHIVYTSSSDSGYGHSHGGGGGWHRSLNGLENQNLVYGGQAPSDYSYTN